MRQKLQIGLAILSMFILIGVVWSGPTATPAHAATDSSSDPCHPENWDPPGVKLTSAQLKSCIACNTKRSNLNSQAKICLQNNVLVRSLNVIVDVLAGLVSVVSIAMIITGGIQYSIARNNPQAISSARKRMLNAAIALGSFVFIWAFLQWLVPGGVFKS